MRRVWLEPLLTRATLVRIEILLAIRRVLSSSDIRCTLQGRGRAPLLHIVSGGRERVFGFVQSCELFGHLLTADDLKFAYRSAGRLFINRLAATFLVLIDGVQPTANFFVPAPRVSRPLVPFQLKLLLILGYHPSPSIIICSVPCLPLFPLGLGVSDLLRIII